jgi:hypothetical protein
MLMTLIKFDRARGKNTLLYFVWYDVTMSSDVIMYSFLCNESTRKCHYKQYHLKCVMAGAYGKYYEEIFGTHFYQTL